MAEDREAFRDLLDRLDQPYAPSFIVEGVTPEARAASSLEALETIGLPAIVRPGLHARRDRRRHRRDRGCVPRTDPGRAAGEPHRSGHGREVPRRLAGDRVRGHARRGRHLHRGLLDGERGPARRAHRRLDRRGAGPDADRRRPPAAAKRGPRHHPRPRRGGRLQRPVRALARFDRVRGHRGEPARQPELRPGLEGDRLSDRPGRRPDRGRAKARRDPQRRDRNDRRRVRAGARLRRRQAAALPVRQVPGRRPDARQPDEGDRRGDGHRPDLRVRAEQGAPRPRAGGRRAAGRGRELDADVRLPRGRLRRATPTPTSPSAGSTRPGRPASRPAMPSARPRRSSSAGSSGRPTAGSGGCSACSAGACPRRSIGEATGISPWFLAEMGRNVALEAEVQKTGTQAGRPRGRRGRDAPRHGQARGLRGSRAGRPGRHHRGGAPDGPAGARPAARVTRWSTRAPPSSRPRRRTSTRRTPPLARRPRRRRSPVRRRWSSARGRSGSGRGSSSTTAPSTPRTRSASSAGARS